LVPPQHCHSAGFAAASAQRRIDRSQDITALEESANIALQRRRELIFDSSELDKSLALSVEKTRELQKVDAACSGPAEYRGVYTLAQNFSGRTSARKLRDHIQPEFAVEIQTDVRSMRARSGAGCVRDYGHASLDNVNDRCATDCFFLFVSL
jgi:hypothetical protein